MEEMKRAGLKPASLSPEEWKSLFSGKGIALPDGRMLMAVKEPAGYGLKITAPGSPEYQNGRNGNIRFGL